MYDFVRYIKISMLSNVHNEIQSNNPFHNNQLHFDIVVYTVDDENKKNTHKNKISKK